MEGLILRVRDDERLLRFFLDSGTHYNASTEVHPILTYKKFQWKKHPLGSKKRSDMEENFKVGAPKLLIQW